MSKPDETAWRELETAISDALWRYAETVTGVRRDEAGDIVEGLPFVSDRSLHLARLSAIRRARQALSAAEPAEAAAATPCTSAST